MTRLRRKWFRLAVVIFTETVLEGLESDYRRGPRPLGSQHSRRLQREGARSVLARALSPKRYDTPSLYRVVQPLARKATTLVACFCAPPRAAPLEVPEKSASPIRQGTRLSGSGQGASLPARATVLRANPDKAVIVRRIDSDKPERSGTTRMASRSDR